MQAARRTPCNANWNESQACSPQPPARYRPADANNSSPPATRPKWRKRLRNYGGIAELADEKRL
jgi:hypothetical protein